MAHKKLQPTRLYLDNTVLWSLSFMNRWHGCIKYRYSVLDHMRIGAHLLQKYAQPAESLAFSMHDYEEGLLVGDVRPVEKRKYLNSAYRARIDVLRERIGFTYGINLKSAAVKTMDRIMLAAEFKTVAHCVGMDDIISSSLDLAKRPHIRPIFEEACEWVQQMRHEGPEFSRDIYHDIFRPRLIDAAKRTMPERRKASKAACAFRLNYWPAEVNYDL